MEPQPEAVNVETYLVVEPEWGRLSWEKDEQGRPLLTGGKVVKHTARRPTVGSRGGVVTKITMRIDADCFLPLQPEAVIHVHAGNAETIEVEAIDPRSESEDAEADGA